MYLNANIPIIDCYVRGNYLRDQKDSHDKYFGCAVFGFLQNADIGALHHIPPSVII